MTSRRRPLLHGTIALGRLTDVQIPVADGAAVVTWSSVGPGRRFARATLSSSVGPSPPGARDSVPALSHHHARCRGADVPLSSRRSPPSAAIRRARLTASMVRRHPAPSMRCMPRPISNRHRRVRPWYPRPRGEKALANTAASPGSKRYAELARARDEGCGCGSDASALDGSRSRHWRPTRHRQDPPMGLSSMAERTSIRLRGGAPTASARVSVKDKDAFAAGAEVLLRNESGDRL